MKKVMLVKASEVNVKPFILDDFTQVKEMHGSISKITKKELKQIADTLGLAYDEKQITFTKKIMTVYLERIGRG